MAKYEIMLVLDPKEDLAVAEKIAKDVFGNGVQKVEKLERTELAYEINKSKTGMFVLMNVETEESNIAEFVRRTNIQKTIWRALVINLDSEKGLNRKTTPKKVKVPFFKKTFNRNNSENSNRPVSENGTDKVVRKPRVKKVEKEESK